MDRLRVAVLMGGTSAEREVSLSSGRKVMGALDRERYQATAVDLASLTQARARGLAQLLFSPAEAGGAAGEAAETSAGRPGVVFIALHGGAGENGTVQGLLEMLGIPYTGSGVLASALAMDKVISKKLFEREGIPTPPWVELRASQREAGGRAVLTELGLPCIVKPACEGSTIGVTVVREVEQIPAALDTAFAYGPAALAERFIEGTEITGGVLGNEEPQVLPLIEIVPAGGFYDYDAKYTPGATQEIIPARIPERLAERARALTAAAHRVLGCRGMSRVDMMTDGEQVYVLEVNSIPGLTETSLVPRAAEAAGISFPELVDRLIALALEGGGGSGGGRGA